MCSIRAACTSFYHVDEELYSPREISMTWFKNLSWIIFLSITSIALADECKVNSQMKAKAHDYMKQTGLIAAGEEYELENIGIVSKWAHVRSLKQDDFCLHVMELCIGPKKGKMECEHSTSGSYEVFASKNGTFIPFEDAVSIPSTLIASIGHPKGSDSLDDLFYVNFTGPEALAALKSVYTKVPVCGFSGEINRDEKASFDPSLSRKWSIALPKFDLRRGMSAEIYDIRASYLDQDLNGYYQACNGKVIPWGGCFVRQLQNDHSEWKEVEYKAF